MHMADALLSPSVGASLWVASAAALAWSARHIRSDTREHLVPLMGVLGAFVFAAQMINFAIPGTGSSGHIGGGLLLSILLGGAAALVVIASILTVQALLFADGGLLALGANIFNMGVIPCFIAYPLIYRPLLRMAGLASGHSHAASSASTAGTARITRITVLASVCGLQLGALGVVIETQLSGISSLPLGAFLLLMQPIHLAIGLAEGLATAAVITFVLRARPDLADAAHAPAKAAEAALGMPTRILVMLGGLALATGGVLSWFASSHPDGLEWSISGVTGQAEMMATGSTVHQTLAAWQEQTALLPDYNFKSEAASVTAETMMHDSAAVNDATTVDAATTPAWPAIDAGTSTAGVLGGLATLLIVSGLGYLLRPRPSSPSHPSGGRV